MNRLSIDRLLIIALVLLFAVPAAAKLRVVATLPDLAAIASEVGGDAVHVTSLAPPNQDPHYVDPRPNLILPLNKADLLIINGLELEVGWLPPLQVAARNGRIQTGGSGYFDASAFVDRKDVPTGKIDRAMGDVHPGGNPHFLLDPRQVRRIAVALAEQMGRIDPERFETYRDNAKDFVARLDALIAEQAELFAALPAESRRVVSYHESMVYLFEWLSLDEAISVEPLPGIPPTPGHTAKVLQTMKSQGIRWIVQERYYPRKTSETLARLVDGEVVVIAGGCRFDDGQTYTQYISDMAGTLYAALSGEG